MGCPSHCYIGDSLVFSICTHDPDTGVLTDAASAPSYRIYEDETGTAIATGAMAKLDDGNTTGFYTETIAVTSANGYEDGKNYTVYISATVDGDTGGIAYTFKAESHPISDLEVENDGTSITLAGFCKLALAVLTGKSSGGGTSNIVFRDIGDSKNRISATVDSNGNRTAVGTRDAS